MSSTRPALALAVTCLLLIGLSSPATAASLGVTGDDGTDMDALVEDATALDVTLDANVTVDADTNASLDADASVDGGTSTDDTSTAASTDAATSISTNGTSAGVDADVSTSASSIDSSLTVGGTLDGTASLSTSLSVGGETDESAVVDLTEPTATPDPTGPTASETTNDDADTSGSPVPHGAPAAAGLAVVAGAAVARYSSTLASATPSTAVRTTVAAAADWLRTELPKFVPVGYSRYDDSDPLEHEVRADLYAAIEDSPGVHLSALDRGSSVSLSTVRHHLRILEAESLVVTERHNGKRRYFPLGTANTALVSALEEPAKEAVLRAVAAHEPASVSHLADALDRDPGTVSHHLSDLEDAGLVDREREGRAVRTSLSPGVRSALEGDATPTASVQAD